MFRNILRLILASLLVISFVAFAQEDSPPGERKVITRVTPDYPAIARKMHLGGTVKMEAVVLPNGAVKSLEVKGGPPILTSAAEDAVRKWKWVPDTHETKEPVIVNFSPYQ